MKRVLVAALAVVVMSGCGGSNSSPGTTTIDDAALFARETATWRGRFGKEPAASRIIDARVSALSTGGGSAATGRELGAAFEQIMRRTGGFRPASIADLTGDMAKDLSGPACRATFVTVAAAVTRIGASQAKSMRPAARQTADLVAARATACPAGS